MIEYLHDCIRATAGENITVVALILGEDGIPVEEGCHFMIYDKDDNLVAEGAGVLAEDGTTEFPLLTSGLKGTYYYCICHDETKLCFKSPIYFV